MMTTSTAAAHVTAPRPPVAAVAVALPAHAMPAAAIAAEPVKRISSTSLMQGGREVEIEHCGKIYRLRITQLNKLILTA